MIFIFQLKTLASQNIPSKERIFKIKNASKNTTNGGHEK